MQGTAGRWVGTLLTIGAPLYFLMQTPTDSNGNPVPVWLTFWSLFGASNQLLAALALLGVTVWLWRTRRSRWVWAVTGLPMLFMYTMSIMSLVSLIRKSFVDSSRGNMVGWIAVLLVALAILMLIDGVAAIFGDSKRKGSSSELSSAATAP